MQTLSIEGARTASAFNCVRRPRPPRACPKACVPPACSNACSPAPDAGLLHLGDDAPRCHPVRRRCRHLARAYITMTGGLQSGPDAAERVADAWDRISGPQRRQRSDDRQRIQGCNEVGQRCGAG